MGRTPPWRDTVTVIDSHFIGRRQPLAVLREAFERLPGGQGDVVLVSGEAGIGKSRLLAELGCWVDSVGGQALRGSCTEGDWNPVLGPWCEIVSDYDRRQADRAWLDRLGEDRTLIANLLGYSVLTPATTTAVPVPVDYRARLATAVGRFLRARASDRPLLVTFDDMHWADEDSLNLLRRLAREIRELPVLVVMAFRPDELGFQHPLSATLASLRRELTCRRIDLRGFDQSEVDQLLESVAGDRLPGAIVARIANETGGNPFYVREVFRHLVETEALAMAEGEWVTDRSLGQLGIPEGIRQVVEARVSRLATSTVTMLRTASAFATSFGFGTLAGVLEDRESAVLSQLEEALDAGLIRTVDQDDERYRFSHALVRQTLYESMSPSRRLRVHRAIAELIEREGGDRFRDELSHHWYQARTIVDPNRVVRALVESGRRAAGVRAYHDAVEQFRRAIEVLTESGRPPTDPQVIDLLLQLGDAGWKASLESTTNAAMRRVLAAGRQLRDPTLIARAALRSTTRYPATGTIDHERIAILEEAHQALADDSPFKVRVLAQLALESTFAGPFEERLALVEQAESIARRLDDSESIVNALACKHWVTWTIANPAERLEIVSELDRRADELGEPEVAALAHGWRLSSLLANNQLDEARRRVAEYQQRASALNQPWVSFNLSMRLSCLALMEGRYQDAERLIGEMVSAGQEYNPQESELFAAIQRYFIMRDLGRLEEILPAFPRIVERYDTTVGPRALLLAALTDLRRVDEARSQLAKIAPHGFRAIPVDVTLPSTLIVGAAACALVGDNERAAELYDLLLPARDLNALVAHGIAFFGAITHYLGLLAATLGRLDQAANHFDHAIARHDAIGAVPMAVSSRIELARLLLRRAEDGDRDAARQLLNEAIGRATPRGIAGFVRIASELLEQSEYVSSAGPTTEPPAPLPAGLTAREAEVLSLLAQGFRSREIAEKLMVSLPTVQRHVSNVYDKVGARSRVDATRFAKDHGLVRGD